MRGLGLRQTEGGTACSEKTLLLMLITNGMGKTGYTNKPGSREWSIQRYVWRWGRVHYRGVGESTLEVGGAGGHALE